MEQVNFLTSVFMVKYRSFSEEHGYLQRRLQEPRTISIAVCKLRETGARLKHSFKAIPKQMALKMGYLIHNKTRV